MSRLTNMRTRNNRRNRSRLVRPPRQRTSHLETNTDMYRFKKAFRRLGMRRFRNHPFYRKMTETIIRPSSIRRS